MRSAGGSFIAAAQLPRSGCRTFATGALDACDIPGDHMSVLMAGNIEFLADDLTGRLPSP